MLSQASILPVVLLCCCFAQASQPCGLSALHDQVMAAADAQMGPFVLFRGEVEALPREDVQPLRAAGTTCCVDKACPNVQCALPAFKIKPPMFLDYSVKEGLWGDLAKPLIRAWYEAASPCGHFNPKLHEKIITYCAPADGVAENFFTFCQRPVADTEENLRKVRAWIPEAISRQVREKVPEEESRTHLIYKVKPLYPKVNLSAPKEKMKGNVVVRIFITKLGRVRSIRAISGPAELTQSAVNAVSLWRYKPFLSDGRRIGVDTTVTVNF